MGVFCYATNQTPRRCCHCIDSVYTHVIDLSYKPERDKRTEGKKMTTAPQFGTYGPANHMMRVSDRTYYSANGKVRVQMLSGSWIVSKTNNDGRYFEAVAGFVTVREALNYAEGVKA